MFYQQGDVILESVNEIPNGALVKEKNGFFVLAEGEATGHAHRIEVVADVEFIEKDGMFYIKNKKPVQIKHEEHKTIDLPVGLWKVRGVQEFDHFLEESRRVAD